MGGVLVDALVVRHIQHALVDAVDELGFVGIVYRHGRPYGRTGMIVVYELRRVDHLKLIGDGRALDDFLLTGGEHIVLHLKAQRRAVIVDALEPGIQAVEQFHMRALLGEGIAREGHAALFGLLQHHIHVCQDGIHPVAIAGAAAQRPEIVRFHIQLGNEGVFLHIARRKRMVKIIHQRQNRHFFHHSGLPSASIYPTIS